MKPVRPGSERSQRAHAGSATRANAASPGARWSSWKWLPLRAAPATAGMLAVNVARRAAAPGPVVHATSRACSGGGPSLAPAAGGGGGGGRGEGGEEAGDGGHTAHGLPQQARRPEVAGAGAREVESRGAGSSRSI